MKTLLELRLNHQLAMTGIKEADTFFWRLKGYMLQKNPASEGILFRNCNSIHSFLMKFELDLYFLDKDYRLLYFERGVRKNRTIYRRDAVHVLETRCGAIEQSLLIPEMTFEFLHQ